MNDITSSIHHSHLLQFGDDTKRFKSISKQLATSSRGEEDLNALFSWITSVHLNFNLSKCMQVSFKSSLASSNLNRHVFFHWLPYLWNSIPIIDFSLPLSIIKLNISGITLLNTLILMTTVCYITYVHAANLPSTTTSELYNFVIPNYK